MTNVREMFAMAVENEVVSWKLYFALAEGFASKPEISKVLINLAEMEKAHEEKLRNSYHKMFPCASLEINPSLRSVFPPLEMDTPEQVLEFAINREEIAADIYHKMAMEADDNETVRMLEQLAKEEENHRVVLETEILRLDGLVSWYDPSELNGLMED